MDDSMAERLTGILRGKMANGTENNCVNYLSILLEKAFIIQLNKFPP